MIILVLLCLSGAEKTKCPSEHERPDELVSAGRMLVKNNRQEEAKTCFAKAVKAHPKYVPALLELGTMESKAQEFDQAVEHLSSAIRQEITPQALNNLAIVYQDMGSHTDSVNMYRRALKIDEDDASAHYNLGTALEKAGDFKAAVKSYRQAIELEPEEAKYYNNMGGSLAAMNKTELAERSYKWAIKLYPKFVDAYYNMGNLHLGTGKVEESIERLEQAIRLNPQHPKAKSKLADAKKELENKMEAFKTQVDDAIKKAEKMMKKGEL
eukprot:CAMPEP_0184321242 /NCGR_PEP_ID=MMETSP1049-20130417/117986_1 /TAXON_ID=77928 /ORGANISM="Proteomonas sulcata, Strain CCMP704" /LENGTH=267 /DNA_ID=CAMNT_0026641973 /DNA_START=428 /DNA_END=1231 /DNA_ORIENTATION=+